MTTSTSPTVAWTNLIPTRPNWGRIEPRVSFANDGSVYLIGGSNGNLHGETSSPNQNAFLTRYTNEGQRLWTKLIGSGDDDAANGLAVVDGAVYVVGVTRGDLNGITNSGLSDAFVARVGVDGVVIWTALIGTNLNESAYSVAVGKDGAVFVAGSAGGNLDGGDYKGSGDAFLKKFRSDGVGLWTTLIGTSNRDTAYGVTISTDGSAYITGFTQRVLLDGKTTEAGAFVSKVNGNGNVVWTNLIQRPSGVLYEEGYGVAVAPDGSVYAVGSADFDRDTLLPDANGDGGFVAKFSSDGTLAWTKFLGTNTLDSFTAVSIGPDNRVYVVGSTGAAFRGSSYAGGTSDGLLLVLDPDGTLIYEQLIGTTGIDRITGVAVNPSNQVALTGITTGNLNKQENSGWSEGDAFGMLVERNFDQLSPTIAISSNRTSIAANDKATFTFTLSEDSTDFTASDVTVTGGTLSNFAGSGASYTATFTPTANSTTNGVISVANGKFSDAAGNLNADGNEANNSAIIKIDTVVPTIAITSNKTSVKAGDTATITFSFSEDPGTSFTWDGTSGDVTVSNGTLGAIAGSGLTRTATFTPTANLASGAASITVAAGSYSDAAGNSGTAGATPSIGIDTVVPTVAITSNKTSVKAGDTATINFTLSEASSDFAEADLSVTGGTLSNFAGFGAIYTATFTPSANSTANGVISVASGKFSDAAGNFNADGSESNNFLSMTLDTVPPSVAITTNKSALKPGETAAISFTLSEPSSDFTLGDIQVAGGSLSSFTGSGSFYSAAFIPDPRANSVGLVAVDSALFTDSAGNANVDPPDLKSSVLLLPVKSAADPAIIWVRKLGSEAVDTLFDSASGSDGAVYSVGHTQGRFNGLEKIGTTNGFVNKISKDGSLDWASLIGVSGSEVSAKAVDVGADNSVFVAGYTLGSIDGQPFRGGGDVFVTKYRNDGTKLWTRTNGTEFGEDAFAITTGVGNAVYVVGGTAGNLDGQTFSGGEGTDGFITKYDANGSKLWTRLIGGNKNDVLTEVVAAIDGFVYVAGHAGSGIADQDYSGGFSDGFISKYTGDGKLLWTRLVGNDLADDIQGLAIGPDGTVFAAGSTYFSIGSQPVSRHSFIVKFSQNGDKVWTKFPQVSGSPSIPFDLSIDGSGVLYLGGLSYDAAHDTFISRFDLDGNNLGTNTLGVATSSLSGRSFSFGPQNSIYLAGGFSAVVNGTAVHPDVFVANWDIALPTIAITSSKSALKFGDSASIIFNLSKPSTDFTASDVTVAGGTLSSFAGSGASYTATFTPSANSTANGVVSVASGKFSDAAGNFNADGADSNNTVTMTVDTALRAIQFASTNSASNEGSSGSTTVTVAATLSAASTQAVTVPILYGGTASLGTDYSKAATTLTIAAGQTTGSATFSVAGDTTVESNETVILTMGTPSNATLGTNATFTHTIINDDIPLTPVRNIGNGRWYQIMQTDVDWSAALKAAAGSTYRGLGGYLVVIDDSTENSFVKTLPGLAGSNFIYWLGITDVEREGTWIIQSGPDAGKQARFFDWFPGEPNNLGEGGEDYVHINIPWVNGSTQWNDTVLQGYISPKGYVVEYGGLPASYTITPSASSVNEGSSVTFTIDTKNVEWGSTLSYTLTGLSQADLASGALTGTTIVNQQGVDGRATVTVNLANDQLTEGGESLRLMVGSVTSDPITVNDLSPPSAVPVYTVTPSASSVNEGSSVTFTIDTKNVESGKTIDYTLSGVVPEEVVGRKLTGTTVVMQNGLDGRATVTVALLADNVSDRDKNLVLTLNGTQASASTLIRDTSVYASYVLDPDSRHYYSFQSDGFSLTEARKAAAGQNHRGLYGSVLRIESAEEQNFVTEKVIPRMGWNGGWLDIKFDPTTLKWINESTNEASSDTRFFNWRGGVAPSATSALNFPSAMIFGDGTWGNHAWSTLQYVVEYGSVPATYTVTPSASSVNEGSSVTFTIDTKNVEWGSTLSYTLTGLSQADLASGALTGTTIVNQQGVDGRATVTVNLANDQFAEAETLSLRVGTTTSAQVRIIDGTPILPVVQFASTVSSANEGNSGSTTVAVAAKLSAASTQAVTVPISYSGTATSGSDYTNASNSITIAAGQTTGSATFSVVGDTVGETNETVILTMGTPSNAALGTNTTFTHTIVNDDTAPPTAQPTGAFLPAGTHIALASPLVNAYGASGQETVMLGAGASQVVLDQNVDRVHLGDAPSAYLFQQTGNRLNVFAANGGERILTAALQTDADGTVIVFPGGSASATVGAGGMRLGGAIVPSAAPTAVVPTLGAAVAPPTGGSTAGVFCGSGANFTAASNGLKVYGAAGNEVLAIARGTSGIEANQLIERLQFNGFATAALSFQQQGNRLNIFEGSTLLARTPLQTDADGTLITTTDGTMQAKVSSAGMFLGGTRVSSTTPSAVDPLEVDTTLKAPAERINVAITAAGTYNAAAGDFTFSLAALNDTYAYTIAGFGTGDRIVGPAGISPSLTNDDLGDGRVEMEYSAAGKLVTIALTGLRPIEDAALFGAADLNAVFGAGTFG